MPLPLATVVAGVGGRAALAAGGLAMKPLVTRASPYLMAALMASLMANGPRLGLAKAAADAAPDRQFFFKRLFRNIGKGLRKFGRVGLRLAPLALGAATGGASKLILPASMAAIRSTKRRKRPAAPSSLTRPMSFPPAPRSGPAPEATAAEPLEPEALDPSGAYPFEENPSVSEEAIAEAERAREGFGESETPGEESEDMPLMQFGTGETIQLDVFADSERIASELIDLIRSRPDLEDFAAEALDSEDVEELSAMLDEFLALTPDIDTDLSEDGVCRDHGPVDPLTRLSLGSFDGRITPGVFYRSNLVTGEVGQLPEGVHGMVTLNELPFPIIVSHEQSPARARVAFAHELAHVANKLYKLGLSHAQVHELGVFYGTEGLPAMMALGSQLPPPGSAPQSNYDNLEIAGLGFDAVENLTVADQAGDATFAQIPLVAASSLPGRGAIPTPPESSLDAGQEYLSV